MGKLSIIILLTLAGFIFLTTKYLFKNLSRFYSIERKKIITYFRKKENNIGEYFLTITISCISGLIAFAVCKTFMLFVAYFLSEDLIDFFIKHRSVYASGKNPLQEPTLVLNMVSGAFLAPLIQFTSIYLMIKGIQTFMDTVNQRYEDNVYSYSSLVYFGTVGVFCFIIIELFAYSQSVTLFNTFANISLLIGSKFVYLLYLFGIFHGELFKKETYRNALKYDWKFNVIEKHLIYNNKILIASLLVVGVILNLPLFSGFQFNTNDWIIILKLIPVIGLFYLVLKKTLSKGFDFIGIYMIDDTRIEKIPTVNFFNKWYSKTTKLGFLILSLFLIFKSFSGFIFFSVLVTVISFILSISLGLSYLTGSIINKSKINTTYYTNIIHSIKQPYIISLFIFLSAFVLITIFPKTPEVKNYTNYQQNIVDKDGNVLYFQKNESANPSIPITYKNLPKFFIKVLIAKEDKGFFKQKNLFFNRQNWHGISFTGGSNLVQQLTKNWAFDGKFPQEYQRKLSEFIFSYQTSISHSPEEILTHYINAVSFNGGKGHKGIVNASYYTFGRNIHRLNELEMLYLLQTLHRGKDFKIDNDNYIPYENTHLYSTEIKKKLITLATIWQEAGFISKKEIRKLHKQELSFKNKDYKLFYTGARNNFFSKSVRNFKTKDVILTSTITLSNQKKIDVAKQKFYRKFQPFLNKNSSKLNAAAIVVNVKTGKILSHYGGEGISDLVSFGEGNSMASLIKPFILLELIEQSYEIRLFDGVLKGRKTPRNNNKPYSKKYVNQNDILKYSKNAPFRNIDEILPPIPLFLEVENKFLQMNIPEDPTINFSDKEEKLNNIINYPIGSRRMTLYNIAQAYQVLINNGNFIPLHHIFETTNPYNFISKKTPREEKNIYSSNATYIIKEALKKVIEKGGTAYNLKKYLPEGEYIIKTGTSHRNRHGYSVISDGELLVVSYVSYGKKIGEQLKLGTENIPLNSGGKSAGVLAALILKEFYDRNNILF